ncbi:MAG: Bax inhibitor-1 family protein [Gemmataceae bacterium]|nr:Bax inhibitor-1 family protein [Gemmataceae bacterium]
MSYSMDYPLTVAQSPASERATFVRRTYAHLAGAILAFVGLEVALLQLPIGEQILSALSVSRYSWLLVLGAFMVVSWVATNWAYSSTSPGLQYAGLSLYVVAEAVIFLPLLFIAKRDFPGAIESAGIMTLAVFGGLTLAVLVTGKDYSFLGPVLTVGSFLAMGAILVMVLFGMNLGIFFCFAMVGLASIAIIYQTSNVMHRFGTTQYVAAALALFAAVALLFWYILQIAMSSRE